MFHANLLGYGNIAALFGSVTFCGVMAAFSDGLDVTTASVRLKTAKLLYFRLHLGGEMTISS